MTIGEFLKPFELTSAIRSNDWVAEKNLAFEISSGKSIQKVFWIVFRGDPMNSMSDLDNLVVIYQAVLPLQWARWYSLYVSSINFIKLLTQWTEFDNALLAIVWKRELGSMAESRSRPKPPSKSAKDLSSQIESHHLGDPNLPKIWLL